MRLKLVPDETSIPFFKFRYWGYAFSLFMVLASIFFIATKGLNFGIDFMGGTTIEIATPEPADIGALRGDLNGLGLGDVQVQTFGSPNDVLIRIQSQGDAEADQQVIDQVRGVLGDAVDYRRVEVVGPKVSGELVESGVTAIFIAVVLMLVYVWFRFEWQFALGSILALLHDVIVTIGIFALLQLEFSLSIIAAVLTIVGYSMNDTVVIYDRIRENLRKYKRMDLKELLDKAVNETLSRTVVTAVTTLLALVALYVFGGEVIRGFTFAMIWGVIIGTYSSVFVAAPILLVLGVKRDWSETGGDSKAAKKGA